MVITDVNQVVYLGDGVTTAFPFTFRIIDATDIKLLLIDTDGTETDITSDYFVDINTNTVHYPGYAPGSEPAEADQPAPVQTGQKLMIYRKLPITQEKDLGDKWPFSVIELGLDKLTMILQQMFDWLGRTLTVSQSNVLDGFDTSIEPKAGEVLAVNADGDGFECRIAMTEVNGAWEGQNLPIHNVGGPVNVHDAATKDYVDSILNGFVLAGDSRTVPFDNVAQMRSADLATGQIAGTLGYYDVNDGGQGIYTIRAALLSDVDNGGSVIILNNGNVAELITDGTINVKQFGTVGDGVTNDTVAIQNAFTAFKNIVFEPGKNYYCASPLIVEAGRNINLNGSTIVSAGKRLLVNAKTTDTYTGYNGNGNIEIYNGTLKGRCLSFIHGQNIHVHDILFAENTQDHYFEIAGCQNFIIENCEFAGTHSVTSDRAYVENVQLDICTYSAFPWFDDQQNVTYDGTMNDGIYVKNCVFKPGTGTYAYLYTCIGEHVKLVNQYHTNIFIEDCQFNSYSFSAIRMLNVNGGYVRNCIFNDSVSSTYSVRNSDGCKNIYIENNRFNGSENGDVITEARSSGAAAGTGWFIRRNEFNGPGYGIGIGNLQGPVVDNNYFAYSYGFTNCTDAIVKNNTCPTVPTFFTGSTSIDTTYKYCDRPVVLGSSDSGSTSTSLTMDAPITDFDTIDVRADSNDGTKNHCMRFKSAGPSFGKLELGGTYVASSLDGYYTLTVSNSDGKNITLSKTTGTTYKIYRIYGYVLGPGLQ